MKRLLSDKRFFLLAILSGIIIASAGIIKIIVPSSFISGPLYFIAGEILSIFLIYGFVMISKKEKNIFLRVTSYTIIIWIVSRIVIKYGFNFPISTSVVLDWLLFLVLGFVFLKMKKREIIYKITAIYIIILSSASLVSETGLEVIFGIYIWLILLALMYILLTLTLYQYLRTMKRRRRRRKK